MRLREAFHRGLAVLGLLTCLGGAAWTGWTAWRAASTGVVRGRHGVVHLRADGDVFYYSTAILNVAASVIWLGLVAFAVLVLARWKDWT
ncbi:MULTISPECIES: hypothetical protein [unclassified Brevundimonas]|uniref:hypothetical protein n=1 Tax=unclassified Brevundimonas TaxID=2622653 RepID=UPI000E846D3E|nr:MULTISPECIES: hypothetical protein [unclassified Brevundimonas]MCK6103899.1 hypothetical protein [Brevundimonas sp. EYE_349]HBI20723.1 hypothetical protein [Brevundimonas sp.]